MRFTKRSDLRWKLAKGKHKRERERKRQIGLCEFEVYPNRGTIMGARLFEGERRPCGRPGAVIRDGQALCSRHDSELGDDTAEIERIAEREEALISDTDVMFRRVQVRRPAHTGPLRCERCGAVRRLVGTTGICWVCRDAAERAARLASIGPTRTCTSCGGVFAARNTYVRICDACRESRAAQRRERFNTLLGMPYGGTPRVKEDKPKPESTEPLQNQFGGRRKFLKDD